MATSTKTPFYGQRGTDDIPTAQTLNDYRSAISVLTPNGTAPLQAVLGRIPSEATTSYRFEWFDEVMPTRSVNVTQYASLDVYTDAALSDDYDAGDDVAAGTVVYVTVGSTFIDEVWPGSEVLLRDADDHSNDIPAIVVSKDTANNALAVRTLKADGTGVIDLSSCDTVMAMSSAHPEGSEQPPGIAYDPTDLYSYTQITRTSVEMTRSQMATKGKTDMEWAVMHSERWKGTGSNGKRLTTTRGIVEAIKAHDSANYRNWVLDGSTTWIAGGEAWLDQYAEQLFRYGPRERLVFMGSLAALAWKQLAQASSTITVTPGTVVKWGLKVQEWMTPFGTMYFYVHPLMTAEPSARRSMLVMVPEYLRIRHLTGGDTMYLDDPMKDKGGSGSVDGIQEGWLTEWGLEYHHTECMGYWTRLGENAT